MFICNNENRSRKCINFPLGFPFIDNERVHFSDLLRQFATFLGLLFTDARLSRLFEQSLGLFVFLFD